MQGIDPIQILRLIHKSSMIGALEWKFSEKIDTLHVIFPKGKYEISMNTCNKEGLELTQFIFRMVDDEGKLTLEISSLNDYDNCVNLRELLSETYFSAIRKGIIEIRKELLEISRNAKEENVKYTVYVDDNYHYGDDDERYTLGIYDSENEAIQAAKKVIDDFFIKLKDPGNDPDKLFSQYCMYGDDPWLSPISSFKAWDYAKKKCEEICKKSNIG